MEVDSAAEASSWQLEEVLAWSEDETLDVREEEVAGLPSTPAKAKIPMASLRLQVVQASGDHLQIENLEFPNLEDETGNFGEKTMDNAVAILMAKTGRGFSLREEREQNEALTKKQEKISPVRNRWGYLWIKCCQGGKPRGLCCEPRAVRVYDESNGVRNATFYLQRGYVPFSGNAAEFSGWVTLTRSLLFEAGLHKILSGAETAPNPLEEGATSAAAFAHERAILNFQEKNGKLYTRLLLATSDGPDGYSSPASQVVQQYGPVGDEEYGDGRAAFVALDKKYRVEGVFSMQQHHDEFASVAVTAADKFDPARAVQQLRRICDGLGKLGDNIVKARQRATVFHAMRIRGKCLTMMVVQAATAVCSTLSSTEAHVVSANAVDAANAAVAAVAEGGKTAKGSTSSDGNNRNNGGGTSGGACAGNAQGARENDRDSQASGGKGAGMHKGRCRNEAEDAKEKAHTTQDSTTEAWFTRVEVAGDELEKFAIAFGDDAQELKAPAAALPEERAVDEDPVQDTPVALPDRLFIYDPQALQVPAAALPENRAAGVEQVHNAPVMALPDGLVVCDPQALQVPAAALPENRAAGVEQVHNAPVMALPDGLVVCDPQALQVPAAALPENRAAGVEQVHNAPVMALPDGLVVCDPQALQVPAAALPENRAAGVEQVHNAPVMALPDGLVVCDPQALQVPAAALPENRAAGVEQVHNAPVMALPDGLVVCDPQALQVPAAALPEERAADEDPVPTAVPPAEGVAGDGPAERPAGSTELPAEGAAGDGPAERPAGDQQAEDAYETTELVRYTNVFQVPTAVPPAEGVAGDGPAERPAGSTELPAEGAAGDGPAERPAGDQQAEDAYETTELVRYTNVFQVDAQSRMSKHVLNPVDCAVRIIGSCGTSSATKKGTLKFGIRNAHDEVVKVALDILLVRDLGANILSVGALAEKGVKCDLMSTPPALRRGDQTSLISTAVPQMYVMNVIVDDLNLDDVVVYHTKVDAHLWHRRMGHCNPRALQQVADRGSTGMSFHRKIESGDCSGAVMFTDDASRMRFGFPIKTKDETAEALQSLFRDVADALGQSIGTVHCDGGAEFKGRFLELCKSVGITDNSSPPYVPKGNAIAERGLGTIIGTMCKMLLGAPHLPGELWAEAFPTAIYLKNRTSTDVLGGKAPLEVWESKPLGKMLHIHEWGSLAFKHEETRFRSSKLAARAKKMYLVGYNPESRSYRLWDPAEPFKITKSAKGTTRFLRRMCQPGAVGSRESEDEDTTPTGPPPVAPGPRRSDRTSVAPQRLNLFTTEEDAYERIEHALVTGSDVGNIGSGRPGEVDSTATRQTVMAVSSAEAEYVAMSKACKMILYWRHLLKTINLEQKEATILYEDSTGAISTSKSNKSTQHNKHIDVNYHHVRSLIVDKVVDVKKIGTDCQ
ncbi:unnamed protein product [Ectocarpus sp. CCAP 1310/34]|nr:unnamed protein product [Ectocarpus sp. CCAP 1310/34]